MKRKVIQLATLPDSPDYEPILYALCEDGTMWARAREQWQEIESVPDDDGSMAARIPRAADDEGEG